jgi:hypothetical protein
MLRCRLALPSFAVVLRWRLALVAILILFTRPSSRLLSRASSAVLFVCGFVATQPAHFPPPSSTGGVPRLFASMAAPYAVNPSLLPGLWMNVE